jgi:hypothetical protein
VLRDCALSALRNGALLGAIIFGSACHAPATLPSERDSADIALFRAVVLAIKDDVGPEVLAIDPRPLIAGREVTRARDNTRAPVSSKEIGARLAVLQDLGVGVTSDDGSFGTCPSVMVPPPPPPGINRKTTECPKSRSLVANVALPRPGGAYVPRGAGAYLPNLSAEQQGLNDEDQVAVRALVTFRGPEGASMTGYDFVMAREASGWKLVKKVAVFWVE